MTEPRAQDAPQPASTASQKGPGAQGRSDQTVEREHRSFQEVAESGAQAAKEGVGAMAQAAGEFARSGARLSEWGAGLWTRPFDPFIRMQSDMLRWFDGLWRESASTWPMQRLGSLSAGPLMGLPPADVLETDKAYTLSIELPGLKREDVDLAIDGDLLSVRGHKAEDRQEAGASYRLVERRFGRFERVFPLPKDVKVDAVQATFGDGVLKITLPRSHETEAQRPSHVEIRA